MMKSSMILFILLVFSFPSFASDISCKFYTYTVHGKKVHKTTTKIDIDLDIEDGDKSVIRDRITIAGEGGFVNKVNPVDRLYWHVTPNMERDYEYLIINAATQDITAYKFDLETSKINGECDGVIDSLAAEISKYARVSGYDKNTNKRFIDKIYDATMNIDVDAANEAIVKATHYLGQVRKRNKQIKDYYDNYRFKE